MKIKFIVVMALLFSGCTMTYSGKMAPEEIVKNAKTKSSPYDSSDLIYLPTLRASVNRGLLGSLDTVEYALGVSSPKDGTEKTQGLLVSIKYFDKEWRFYDSADFVGGLPAELKSQNRNVSGCSTYSYLAARCNYTEVVTIKLEKEFIRANPNGFSVRLNSKEGKQNVVVIPGNYMQAFTSLLER